MGILTRQQGLKYIITSDEVAGEAPSKRAPRMRPDVFQVWTGAGWSANASEALSFESLDDADDYVRINYITVSNRSGG